MLPSYHRSAPMLVVALSLLAISGGAPALAQTVCAAASGPVQAPILTHGMARTRTGLSIPYETEAGWLRVHGGGVGYGKSVWNVPPPPSAPVPMATMSYYAFRAARKGADTRPLVFIWDGGPGTSTLPMLLNSFGPSVLAKHAATSSDAPPTPMRDNPDTLLDVADLVFVDAPGTGFGLEGCDAARGFYGVDVDAAAFQRFIQQYIATHHRERSPVILMGESYGTTRAAVVARRLQQAGVRVEGVVLISQILSLDNWSDGSKANIGTENAAFTSLPSYAATAWFHGKVNRAGDFETFMRRAERFAIDEYAPALLAGANLTAARRSDLARRLSYYTGLPPQTWLNEDLRIEASRFRDLLEASDGKIVGREDTRDDGPVPKVRHSAVEDDPRPPASRALAKRAFETYVRGTLGLGARPFAPYIDGPDTRWDMHHLTDPNAWPDTYVNVVPDLVEAMRANPGLRVFLAGGYYDVAAPYFGGAYLVSHLPRDVAGRVERKAYPAPHSVYADDDARTDMHREIAKLIAAGR